MIPLAPRGLAAVGSRAMRGLVLVLVVLAGCIHDVDGDGVIRVGIAGDSNSTPGWTGFPMWGELLDGQQVPARHGGRAYLAPVVTVTVAAGGATACDHSDVIRWSYGPGQVAALLAHEPPVDVVIAAFGTNDIGQSGTAPAAVVACLELLEALVPASVLFLPATAPPRTDGLHADALAELNARIRARWAAVVDFDTAVPPALFRDAVHLDAPGQAQRMQRARAALVAYR